MIVDPFLVFPFACLKLPVTHFLYRFPLSAGNVISNDHYDQYSCIHGIFLFQSKESGKLRDKHIAQGSWIRPWAGDGMEEDVAGTVVKACLRCDGYEMV